MIGPHRCTHKIKHANTLGERKKNDGWAKKKCEQDRLRDARHSNSTSYTRQLSDSFLSSDFAAGDVIQKQSTVGNDRGRMRVREAKSGTKTVSGPRDQYKHQRV